jgi:hypothetical protein
MARNFLTPINLNGLELQGAVIGNLSTTSINALTGTGRIQYDSTLNVLKYRDNTGWQTISTGGGSFYLGSTSVSLGNISGSVTSITGLSITGNAATATALQTSRTINGVGFDGTAPITVKASTTYTLGLTNSNLAFSSGTTWDGGTSGITIGLSATPTSITSINGISVTGSSGSFLTSASTASVLTSVGTLNGLAVASSQTITMGSNRVTNVADPTASTDAATKNYVDNVAQGINVHDAVVGIVTTSITGTYAIGSTTANPPGDGGTGVGATITYTATGVMTSSDSTSPVTFAAGDRVLITGGVSSGPATWTPAIANGIYVVTTAGAVGTAAVLTRATDADNSIFGDLAAGDLVYIISGGTYGGTQWVQTTKGTATTGSGASTKYSVKISTDSIAYTQFSGAGAVPYASTTVAGIASFPSAQFSVGGTGAVTIGNLAGSLITSGTVGATYGGTGVNNGSNTITLAGTLQHAGAFSQIFRATANTDITLPTTGTLATLTGSEALTNKSINGLTVTSSTGTLTVVNGSTLATAGAFSTTLTATATTNVTLPTSGTLARKATQVGTGTGATISWTNTWSTNLVVAQVYDTSTATATLVECDITATTSAVVATFASASTTLSNYTLVITG